MRPTLRSVLLVASVSVLVGGCSGAAADSGRPRPAQSSTGAGAELSGELVVFAAASLQGTFTELGDRLMAEHPGLTITLNFAGSSALSQQLLSGAPADVFASANTSTMEDAAEVVGEPVTFAHNTLEIAVPAGNPAGVTGIADLGNPALKIALCAVEVPCGAAAAKALEAAGVAPAPDTYEQDVSAVLTKVSLGEVDAALVYRTDVSAAGGSVEGIEFPEATQAINDYQIAVVEGTDNPSAANAFVALVLSPAGQEVLSSACFDRR